MLNSKVLIFFVWTCSCLVISTQSKFLDGWIEPDAWSRSSLPSSQSNDDGESCKACNCEELQDNKENIVDKISLIYYKKLITFLLNRKDLEFDDEKGLYHRTLLFTITPTQIDKLEKSIDPRDWDATLGEILPKVQKISHNKYEITYWFKTLLQGIGSVFKWFLYKLSLLSELRFELVLVFAVLIIFFINRMYGIILALIIFGTFTCGIELVVVVLIIFFINRMYGIILALIIFGTCTCGYVLVLVFAVFIIIYIKGMHGIGLAVITIFGTFTFEYIYSNFYYSMKVIEHSVDIIYFEVKNLCDDGSYYSELIPFPYNIVASIIFCATLVTLLKLFFKCVLKPKVESHHWQCKTNDNQSLPNEPSASSSSSLNYHDYDRLSGKNLNVLECRRQIEPTIHKLENIYSSAFGVQVSEKNVIENISKINKNEKEIAKSSLVEINSKNDENEIKINNLRYRRPGEVFREVCLIKKKKKNK